MQEQPASRLIRPTDINDAASNPRGAVAGLAPELVEGKCVQEVEVLGNEEEADGEVDESEKEAMRGNVKVMLPNVSDDEYNQMEAEVIDKFIDLGDEEARMNQYGVSLEALKDVFTTDEDRYKVVKNLAYIARADDFIHENEMAMVEKAVSSLDMVDKVNLVKTDSTLFVDPTF